jgi:hypothetical protein
VPLLDEGKGWSAAVNAALGVDPTPVTAPGLAERIARRVRELAGKAPMPQSATLSLGWMPVARYQPHWHAMPAFALPSFYDGRVRVNLSGREAQGRVPLEGYDAVLTDVESVLSECRDVITRQPVVARIERTGGSRPLDLSSTESDLVIEWRGVPLGFDHPTLGRIGPLPYRRTGGHTGHDGMAWVAGPGVAPGDLGEASAFDVVPTVIDLMGLKASRAISGRSWKSRIAPERNPQPA